MNVCVCACSLVYGYTCVSMHTCGGLRLALGVSLDCHSSYSLTQVSQLNPELANMTGLPVGMLCVHPPSTGRTGWPPHPSSRFVDLNFSSHTYAVLFPLSHLLSLPFHSFLCFTSCVDVLPACMSAYYTMQYTQWLNGHQVSSDWSCRLF